MDRGDDDASIAAKNLGEDKIKYIASYYMGRIAGWLAAESIEDLASGLTNLGFYITNPSTGRTVHFKFAGTDSGKISFQPGDGTQPYGYFKDALQGFIDGLKESLGM